MIVKKNNILKDEAKHPKRETPSKQKAAVNVHGSVRATKKGGVSTVDAHTRVIDKNVEGSSKNKQVDPAVADHMREMGYDPNNSVIADAFDSHLSTGEVSGMARLEDMADEKGGITKNVVMFTLKNKKGEKKNGFFKSVKDDPFIASNRFLRSNDQYNGKDGHITLNSKDNTPLSKQDHVDIHGALNDKTLPSGHKTKLVEGKKGQMNDRELGTVALGKMLKMDHVANGSVRNFEIDGKMERGFISEDLKGQFKESGSRVRKGYKTNRVTDKMAKSDPKFGDKVMFDYMNGNTDRHGNNFYVKEKQGKAERLDFDHGLTFGNNNAVLRDGNGFGYNGTGGMWGGPTAQGTMRDAAIGTKVSKEFANALNDIVEDASKNGGGKFAEFTSFLEEKIGKNEASAFKERFADVVEGVLGKNDKDLSPIINRTSQKRRA